MSVAIATPEVGRRTTSGIAPTDNLTWSDIEQWAKRVASSPLFAPDFGRTASFPDA